MDTLQTYINVHLVCRAARALLTRRQPIVLIYIDGLPRVADPHVAYRACRLVPTLLDHLLGQGALLWFVLVLHAREVSIG